MFTIKSNFLSLWLRVGGVGDRGESVQCNCDFYTGKNFHAKEFLFLRATPKVKKGLERTLPTNSTLKS